MSRLKTISFLTAILMFVAFLTACSVKNGVSQETEVQNTQKAVAAVTPKATEMQSTDTPDKTTEATQKPAVQARPMGDYKEYTTLSSSILNGAQYDLNTTVFNSDSVKVYFRIEGDRFNVYLHGELCEDGDDLHWEFDDLYTSLPAELGIKAKASLAECIRENTNPSFEDYDELVLTGFFGTANGYEYAIIGELPFHGYQASVMFFTADGEEWTEIPMPKGFAKQLTGGCMISEERGFICYFDRELMYREDYSPCWLTVYMTKDGGKTWEDMGLRIPEEYEPEVNLPAQSLTPVFSGDHGVLFLSYATLDRNSGEYIDRNSYFETFDGGETWEFNIG